MLVMSLEEEHAAEVLKHMSEEAAAKLRNVARGLDASRIGNQHKREALLNFFKQRRQGSFYLGDPERRFREVLALAKGEEAARRICADSEEETSGEQPGDLSDAAYIAQFPEEQLAGALEEETPRCIALLMSAMEGQKAGRVVNLLEEDVREAVLERVVANETVPPEIAEQVIGGFREKLERIGGGAGAASEEGRTRELAGLIGALDQETQEAVLARIAEQDPEMAQEIERLIFGFDDLLKVSDRSMQELLRNVEVVHIALALKGADPEMQEHFAGNLSQRQLDRVEEEREMAGRVPLSEVESAREEIMQMARRMYREGQLIVEMGDEQYVE